MFSGSGVVQTPYPPAYATVSAEFLENSLKLLQFFSRLAGWTYVSKSIEYIYLIDIGSHRYTLIQNNIGQSGDIMYEKNVRKEYKEDENLSEFCIFWLHFLLKNHDLE